MKRMVGMGGKHNVPDAATKRSRKKHFQLLYRERDDSPSSDAFEAIIFMKGKKFIKDSVANRKGVSKKSTVADLKQTISNFQNQLKAHANPIDCDNTVKLNLTEAQKVSFASKLSKHHLTILKPTSHANIPQPSEPKGKKSDQQKVYASTAKRPYTQCASKQSQRRRKRSIQKSPNLKLVFPEQYVFLQDSFHPVNNKQTAFLEEKLFTKRNRERESCQLLQQHLQRVSNQQDMFQQESSRSHDQQTYENPLDESEEGRWLNVLQNDQRLIRDYSDGSEKWDKQQIEREWQDLHWSQKKDFKEIQGKDKVENHQQILKVETQNWQTCTHNVNKIILIQQWWRDYLSTKRKDKPVQTADKSSKGVESPIKGAIECLMTDDNEHKEVHSTDFSPIRIIGRISCDEINEINKSDQDDSVTSLNYRCEVASIQLRTQQKILRKLMENNRITIETYHQKSNLIQSKFQCQLEQIEEIRTILADNTKRIEAIVKKTKQCLEICDNLGEIDDQTIDAIFGNANASLSDDLVKLKSICEERIINRQKSTGCHVSSSDSLSIYKKIAGQGNQISAEDETDFYENNMDSKDFETQINRMHFGDADFKELLDEYKERQHIKGLSDSRVSLQLGLIADEASLEFKNGCVGISTSILELHSFLITFFKFYIFYYRDDFLRLINMPYEHNMQRRLQTLQGSSVQAEDYQEGEDGRVYGIKQVISSEMFDDFYDNYYDNNGQGLTMAQKANIQFEKIHNRAVFDTFNEALNQFRPYYLIKGEPYPWNYSQKALTFYFICEDGIQEVFEKTQLKVLKNASCLCGLLLEGYGSPACPQQITTATLAAEHYKTCCHPVLLETREDRLTKSEQIDIIEHNYEWELCDEQRTSILYDIAAAIFETLKAQVAAELKHFSDELVLQLESSCLDCYVQQQYY